MMMRLFFSILFLASFALSAQELKPLFPGVGFSVGEENELLSMKEYEACYCYPVFKKNTDSIIGLKPIVYPLPVKKSGLWGAINQEGTKVADFTSTDPVLYTKKGRVQLKDFEIDRYQWSTTDESRLILLDSNGVEKLWYTVADTYKGAFAASQDEKYWGVLNSKLETIVDFEYTPSHVTGEDFVFSKNGYLTLRENKPGGYNGVVDYKGKTIIPFKWLLLSYVIEDEAHIYAMNENRKRGYIDIDGHTTLSFIYDKIPREITDSNRVETEKYIYYLDENLQQIGPKYQAHEKKGNVWFYKMNGKWGIRDINNKEIIPNIYSTIMDGPRIRDNSDFKCYIVVKNGKYGLITLDGEVIIEPAYECLCGLGYYAPSDYYIEFQKAGVSYKFSETGELIEKGGKSAGGCFCE